MISVIVPTRSRYNNLRNTIEALSNQSLSRDQYEIIVSDDNSTDETQTILNQFRDKGRFKYVFNNYKPHTWNASIPRNLGALVADPETSLYVFIDSDVVVPHHHLETVLKDHLANPQWVIIGSYEFTTQNGDPVSLPNGEKGEIRGATFREFPPEVCTSRISDALACFGGNISIPKEVFWSVGGFSPEINIGLEDGDMGLKLWKVGAQFSYDDRLRGKHQWHEVPNDRFPNDMAEHINQLNQKHFHMSTKEVDQNMDLISASRETYKTWGIEDWTPPAEWRKNQLNLTLKVNKG